MQETQVRSLGRKDSLEKEMATHSIILAWRIPWTEEPAGLQSMGSQSWTQLSDKPLYFQVSRDSTSSSAVRPLWAGEAGERLEVMQGTGSAIPWALFCFSGLYRSRMCLQFSLLREERTMVLVSRMAYVKGD